MYDLWGDLQYGCEKVIRDKTKTTSSADADKPARRVYRSVKVTKRGTIRYVRYDFLLANLYLCVYVCVCMLLCFSMGLAA